MRQSRECRVKEFFAAAIVLLLFLTCGLGVASANDGRRALAEAAKRGDLKEVQRLLDAGVSPNETPSHHLSALVCAVDGRHREVVKLLLDRGADANLPSEPLGTTPLMEATANEDIETVRLLLSKGADVNLKDKLDGSPALFYCIHAGNLAIARLLLDHGADIHARLGSGPNALGLAVCRGRYRIAHLLIQRGATLTIEEWIGVLYTSIKLSFRDKQ